MLWEIAGKSSSERDFGRTFFTAFSEVFRKEFLTWIWEYDIIITKEFVLVRMKR